MPSLLHIDIAQIAEALEARRISSVDLVEAYLARIDEAKEFCAVLETNPDALGVARELDEERLRTGSRRLVNPPEGICRSIFPNAMRLIWLLTVPYMAFLFSSRTTSSLEMT